MRRTAATWAVVAAAAWAAAPARGAAACSARTPDDPAVPAWRAVNGFALGERPATAAELDRYLLAVDAATPRVRTFLAGRSVEGRPLRVAAVGAPGTLAHLERLARRLRGVRAGRAGLPARAPAFVWLAGSVHGGEPSGADADAALLAELARGRTCADLARLRRVVAFVLPVQNPDGREAARRTSATGFDLNRDWFARTQPETRARVRALVRYPPVVFADQHEEGGEGFFFPPNADPVHHEVPAAALRAIDTVVAPRLRRAFDAAGYAHDSRRTYDLFFMGYGDTAPTTLFGAAGMTYEKGNGSPFARRVAEQLLAARTTVRAAAASRGALLRRWATSWRTARAQGRRGVLAPNRVLEPGHEVRYRVPAERVYGYVLRADVHGADAAALVARLRSVGVRVLRLRAGVRVEGLRGYGEPAAGAADLPAGTYVVPTAQAAKHWVQALLGEDPYAAVASFYDVAAWSNPLLMGLRGGLLTAPLRAAAEPVGADRPAPVAAAPAYAFAGGSQGALELALARLRGGADVRRLADGSFAAGGDARADARARRVALRPLDALPAEGRPLRLPRVGLLADGGESTAWARWLLAERYGLAVRDVEPARLEAGLRDLDVLVAAAGTPPAVSDPALLALQQWVRAGGSLVGAGRRGLQLAQAAGVTAVREEAPPSGFVLPGVSLRVALDPADPVSAGEEAEGWVFADDALILAARGARVAARYPGDARFFVSGRAAGAEALRGTPAITDEPAGAGRVVLFAFDPAFRGYTEGTERLLGNALLAGPTGAPVRRAREPGPIDPAALTTGAATRAAAVQVAAGDEAALLAAARAAGVPASARLERDLTMVTLRVPLAGGPDAEPPPWARRLPAALAAAGVTPLLAAL